ncbi:MAG: NAD(P)-dependent alcohol dehydrogenase [Rhodospirillaceae bacterium]|nr:NAD(P)-dependent alcohol dehydrogenase [Rhodospirillaceae bacterium]|tara:strand:- start:23031 stop:24116 length:1086 start_codon:yes stop_codon:yes gene_type:complete
MPKIISSLRSAIILMLFVISSSISNAHAQNIRQYQLESGPNGSQLVMRNVMRPEPAANEVLVQIHAVSLNRRDLAVLDRNPPNGLIPTSDGAGEVVAIGSNVTEFSVGDRVAGTFFANWPGGRRTAQALASGRGGGVDGMLSEMIVSHETGLVLIPEYLSYEEAATLPCAALTAWRALFTEGNVKKGQHVLLEGTGGVSIFGLQLAAAAGAKPIITSSSDEKLVKARELGAVGTVNYRTNTEWQKTVLELTEGAGIDHVLDVVGRETLYRAIETLAFDGHIAVIGQLSGRADVLPLGQIPRGASVTNIAVGSRDDFKAMNEFLTEHELRPVIDRVFSFEEAPAAYEYMNTSAHLGKIVITL